jgi:hypothetical protein
MHPNVPQEMLSVYSFNTLWATVVNFKKTKRSEQIFDCLKLIQNNFEHYANIHGFISATYRNDYAFAMADVILNGFRVPTISIPGPMLNILQPIKSMTLQGNQVVIKDKHSAYVVPQMNMHIMSKAYLQSDNFKEFIGNVTT